MRTSTTMFVGVCVVLAMLLTAGQHAEAAAEVVVHVPAAHALNTVQDSAFVLFGAAGVEVEVAGGASYDAANDKVDITVSDGASVALVATGGVTVTTAGATTTLVGALADVNAALSEFEVIASAGFAGHVLVTITATADSGSLNRAESFTIAVNAAIDGAAMRNAILAGVNSFHGGASPGYVAAFESTAHTLLEFVDEDGQAAGMFAAAGSLGAGRVVLYGDHQALEHGAGTSADHDSSVLMDNSVRWSLGLASGDSVSAVTVVSYSDAVVAWAQDSGYMATKTSDATLVADLAAGDVFVGWLAVDNNYSWADDVIEWIGLGGAVVAADYGIGWDWWWGGIENTPTNKVLRQAGLAVTQRWPTGHAGVITMGTDIMSGVTATVTIQTVLGAVAPGATYTYDESRCYGDALSAIFDALPMDDPAAITLDEAIKDRWPSINPTPDTPLADPLLKAISMRESDMLAATPPADVTKHRTADALFGAIAAAAPRGVDTLLTSTTYDRWQSTGLYVPAGEVVVVTFTDASGATQGFKAQISGHTDDVCQRNITVRLCKPIARTYDLDAQVTQIASAFGGALYIDLGRDGPRAESFELTVDGAVKAPYFVLGSTTNAEWQTLRNNPAPQAELVSEHVAFSLRSNSVVDVDDMQALMEYWDSVVQYQDELGGFDAIRTYAYRINIDVQISVGYLHSGYPTQGPSGTADDAFDLDTVLDRGSWGWFHELGHESQRRPDGAWSYETPYGFNDATEVTVNLFSAYSWHRLELPSREGWGWAQSAAETMERAIDLLGIEGSTGKDFGNGGAGDKLSFYLLLQHAFGWGAYKDLIRMYSAIEDDGDATTEVPTEGQDKRDGFLLRMSNITGYSLANYMQNTWGLQLSASATSTVSAMPDWQPVVLELPEDDIEVNIADDDAAAIIEVYVASLDNAHTVTASAEHGTVQYDGLVAGESRRHTFVYTPEPFRSGDDTVTFTAVSSTGFTQSKDAMVTALKAVEVTGPFVATTTVNVGIVFSADNLNAIRVRRVRADDDDTVTISLEPATAGALMLQIPASVQKLAMDAVYSGVYTSITLQGTSNGINDALEGLEFMPAANYTGRPRLVVSVAGPQTADLEWKLPIAVNAEIDLGAATTALLAGVNEMHSGVGPGTQEPYGDQAGTAVVYSSGSPWVTVATWGSGRVVSLPDHQALDHSYLATQGPFVHNAIRWSAGVPPTTAAANIKVWTLDSDVAAWLSGEGYGVELVSGGISGFADTMESLGGTPPGPGNPQVFYADWLGSTVYEVDSPEVNATAEFVAAGGGLLITDFGIGWDWWWGGHENCFGNVLLREPGIGYRSSGHGGPDILVLDTDYMAATATDQRMSAQAALEVLLDATSPADAVAEATTVKDYALNVLKPYDPLAIMLARLSCGATQAVDPSTGDCVDSCGMGNYMDDQRVCGECHRSCAACEGSPRQCTACAIDWTYVHDNECVSMCPPGTMKVANGSLPIVNATHECVPETGGGGGQCSTSDVLPHVFKYDDGSGSPKLVTDDCNVIDCDASMPSFTVGGTTFHVLRNWAQSLNIRECDV